MSAESVADGSEDRVRCRAETSTGKQYMAYRWEGKEIQKKASYKIKLRKETQSRLLIPHAFC